MRKICMIVLCLSVLTAGLTAADKKDSKKTAAGNKYYTCSRCNKLQVVRKMPAATAAGKCRGKSNHSWKFLAAVGDNYYNCNRCFMVLPAKSRPQPAFCMLSQEGHVWVRVGKIGKLKYRCKKCSLALGFAKQPESGAQCKKGGMHEWAVLPAKK